MRILVVNAGSSSMKLRLLDDDTLLEKADLAADSDGFDTSQLRDALAGWPRPDAVGHRIVHGGAQFGTAVRITDTVEQQLRNLTDLAPLHQPKSLAGLDTISQVFPDVAAYACFDTAFHATMPSAAYTYAVPRAWRERYGLRRYGFHGLSHAYAFRRGAQLTNLPADVCRIVSCHLGAGASLCAIRDGTSRDTTMGFTPLDGLVMATRSGSVDPGLVLWLEAHEHLAPLEITTALEQRSGMLALAGTSDMREVVTRAESHDAEAVLALDVYIHRLAAGIAAMAAATDGLDLVVFTGGVGEHSQLIRAATAQRLAWLGLAVDETANEATTSDSDISASGAAVRCAVVTAREDLQIAREIRAAHSL